MDKFISDGVKASMGELRKELGSGAPELNERWLDAVRNDIPLNRLRQQRDGSVMPDGTLDVAPFQHCQFKIAKPKLDPETQEIANALSPEVTKRLKELAKSVEQSPRGQLQDDMSKALKEAYLLGGPNAARGLFAHVDGEKVAVEFISRDTAKKMPALQDQAQADTNGIHLYGRIGEKYFSWKPDPKEFTESDCKQMAKLIALTTSAKGSFGDYDSHTYSNILQVFRWAEEAGKLDQMAKALKAEDPTHDFEILGTGNNLRLQLYSKGTDILGLNLGPSTLDQVPRPEDSYTELVNGVRYFKANNYKELEEVFRKLEKGQKPETLLITCSDSRIVPSMIANSGPGKIFVFRNIGNVVQPYNDKNPGSDAAAAVEYAVKKLQVKDIIVCGHAGCGACHAMLEPPKEGALPAVSDFLKGNPEALKAAAKLKAAGGDEEKNLETMIKTNAEIQASNLENYPFIKDGYKKEDGTVHRTRVHVWIYNIKDGEVEERKSNGAYEPIKKRKQ